MRVKRLYPEGGREWLSSLVSSLGFVFRPKWGSYCLAISPLPPPPPPPHTGSSCSGDGSKYRSTGG